MDRARRTEALMSWCRGFQPTRITLPESGMVSIKLAERLRVHPSGDCPAQDQLDVGTKVLVPQGELM